MMKQAKIMNKIRYEQRDCKDQDKIEKFLHETRIGVIGMNGDDFPYAVPVNFVWYEGSIYFHGAGSGKKVDILSEEPPVCFTVYEEYGTTIDPMPCSADTSYMSVMLFGKMEKVADFEESATVLWKIVEKYMPGYYDKPLTPQFIEKYKSDLDDMPTSVFKLTPSDITAKVNEASPEEIFKE
jgi:nitroimidazol reductase NimA-like FMN-containing flavoprotein (pyridoxamine 5'-phosphate oxidase superfamily)